MNIKENVSISKQALALQSFLGSGSCGAVVMGTMGKLVVAIKMLKARPEKHQAIQDICKDLIVMIAVQCPYLCQVYGCCVVDNDELWVVMEYVDGGNLREYILQHGPLKLDKQVAFMHAVALAVRHLHSKGVIHKDIKPSNILVRDDEKLALTGFGLNKMQVNCISEVDTAGSLRTTAPEVLMDGHRQWTEKADIYSLGMVFYEIATGTVPFSKYEDSKVAAMVKKGKRPKIPNDCPEVFAKLIQMCWHQDPHQRPTVDFIVQYIAGIQVRHIQLASKKNPILNAIHAAMKTLSK